MSEGIGIICMLFTVLVVTGIGLHVNGSNKESMIFSTAVEREYPEQIDVEYVSIEHILKPIYKVEFEYRKNAAECDSSQYCRGIDECERARCRIDSDTTYAGVMYLVRPWSSETYYRAEMVSLQVFVDRENLTIEEVSVHGDDDIYSGIGKDNYVYYWLRNRHTGENANVYCPMDNTILCYLWRGEK